MALRRAFSTVLVAAAAVCVTGLAVQTGTAAVTGSPPVGTALQTTLASGLQPPGPWRFLDLAVSGSSALAAWQVQDGNRFDVQYSWFVDAAWSAARSLPEASGVNRYYPSAHIAADGTTTLTWYEDVDPLGSHRYTFNIAQGSIGGGFAAPQVITGSGFAAHQVDFFDGPGGLWIGTYWTLLRPTGSGYERIAYPQAMGGTSTATPDGEVVNLTAIPAGVEDPAAGSAPGIYGVRSWTAADGWGDFVPLTDAVNAFTDAVTLTLDRRGRPVLAYSQPTSGGQQVFVRTRRDGTWSPPQPVSALLPGGSIIRGGFPNLGVQAIGLPGDALVTVWNAKDPARHSQLWYAIQDSTGRWSPPAAVSTDPQSPWVWDQLLVSDADQTRLVFTVTGWTSDHQGVVRFWQAPVTSTIGTPSVLSEQDLGGTADGFWFAAGLLRDGRTVTLSQPRDARGSATTRIVASVGAYAPPTPSPTPTPTATPAPSRPVLTGRVSVRITTRNGALTATCRPLTTSSTRPPASTVKNSWLLDFKPLRGPFTTKLTIKPSWAGKRLSCRSIATVNGIRLTSMNSVRIPRT